MYDIDKLIAKSRLLGKVTEVEDGACFLETSDTDIIFYIPSHIRKINRLDNTTYIKKITLEYARGNHKNLKVIGGSGLENINKLFSRFRLNSIDLSEFDTHNVKYMVRTFENTAVDTLDVTTLNTENVINMEGMFLAFRADNFVIKPFNTKNVMDMSLMFSESLIKSELDLTSFDVSNVITMEGMFKNSWNSLVNLRSFKIGPDVNTNDMFTDSHLRLKSNMYLHRIYKSR